uniref:Uncharacterized protein n=1 Tax=Siphoviridae sp. ctNHg2 TaxID=2825467 RepID=A0A8S5V493_9CAUD|nr:MAG TPA: hypothetical protein [Siphoviridae sp. ctNHg2]
MRFVLLLLAQMEYLQQNLRGLEASFLLLQHLKA